MKKTNLMDEHKRIFLKIKNKKDNLKFMLSIVIVFFVGFVTPMFFEYVNHGNSILLQISFLPFAFIVLSVLIFLIKMNKVLKIERDIKKIIKYIIKKNGIQKHKNKKSIRKVKS